MIERSNQSTMTKKAWFHVDMDGLNAIFKGHGRAYQGEQDAFYASAVENSLALFDSEGITATYFVIAGDLDNPDKLARIKEIVSAGHHVAAHGMHHRYLDKVSSAEKREETVSAKQKIEDTLGVPCYGFRAPGYSLDFESLELLRAAGYRYDSSIYPSYRSRRRLGIERLYPEPFTLFPEDPFFEIPLPYLGPLLPPFHPSYTFYLTRFYFNLAFRAFRKGHNYLTYLLHLTDFASPQKLDQGLRLNIFTNNFISAKRKRAFLTRQIGALRDHYSFTTTEEFLDGWPASAPDLNPNTILGISTTHETGACVVREGQVLSAISEERLSRKKLDNKYPPMESVREAIRISGVEPQAIDAVAIAGLRWPDLLAQSFDSFWTDMKDFHSFNDYFPHFGRILYRLFYFWRAARYDKVLDFLRTEYGISPKVYYVEHHEAHAASVYRTGGKNPALIITADGVGDDIAVTFSLGQGSLIRRLGSLFYPNSFGQFYTACTQILGFKGGRHEGKITGLSGFGKPNEELIQKVEQTYFNEDGFKLHKRYYAEGFIRFTFSQLKQFLRGKLDLLTVEYRNYKMPLKRLLAGYSREDIAFAFQTLLEREMVRLARGYQESVGADDLALAGGVFANVKLNMALSQDLAAESLYIFPAMGDGGLCVGAALNVAGERPFLVHDMYLGTCYSEEEILRALEKYPHLTYTRPEDMAHAVASELTNGSIVARFDGRMEFGPRALGNRSILYHCADPEVNDWLNRQLKRTEFMPFAPICIYEDAAEYFILKEGEKRPCEFMTLVVRCTDKMKDTCPAAVHVDGTARPQLVRHDINPGMYGILKAYKERTGISCLINTSFNMHEEPIVRSPEEAIRAFLQSHLNALVLGPFLVKSPEEASA